ncbi:hypothetical protein D3C81_1913160 [compost metagenome]
MSIQPSLLPSQLVSPQTVFVRPGFPMIQTPSIAPHWPVAVMFMSSMALLRRR